MYAFPLSSPAIALSRRAATRARAAAGLPRRRRGGQPGNHNRLVHGRYSRAFLARRAQVRAVLCQSRALLAEMRAAASLQRFTMLTVRRRPNAQAHRGLAFAAAVRRNFYNTRPPCAGYARAGSTRTRHE